MNSEARRHRRIGHLRQIARQAETERRLRAELEMTRDRRDSLREQVLALHLVLVHEFGQPAGEGHAPACEVAVRLLREHREQLAGLAQVLLEVSGEQPAAADVCEVAARVIRERCVPRGWIAHPCGGGEVGETEASSGLSPWSIEAPGERTASDDGTVAP